MKNKVIKRNYFSKIHYYLFVAYVIGICLFSVFIGYLMATDNIDIYFLFVYVIFVFTFSTLYIILINPLLRAIVFMNKRADYGKFEKRINNILNNNLDDESRNYVLMIKFNYMFAINKKEAIYLFENIKKPSFKRYLKDYYNIKACYHINKREFDEAYSCICEMKKLNVSKKIIRLTNIVIDVIKTNDDIEYIEKYFLINTPLKFTNLSSANILLIYYYTRNKYQEAKECAEFIKKNTKCLTEFIKYSDEVLEKISINI